MDQDHIDALLERYLLLLDEYTALRTRLSSLQSSVYHNIARANFCAERGLRYGQDQYDERMQASRRLRVEEKTSSERSAATFTVVDTTKTQASQAPRENVEEMDVNKTEDQAHEAETETDQDKEKEEDKKEKASKPVNPLRWFGVLTPQPLRNAQSQSTQAIEDVIPRLVTINAEMLDLEIEVRRARKKRAKTADKKDKVENTVSGLEPQAVEAS